MLEMTTPTLVQMHVHTWSLKKTLKEFNLRDVSDECFIGAKRLLALTVRAIIPSHCTGLLFISWQWLVDLLAFSVKTSYAMTSECDRKKSLWNKHLSNDSNLTVALLQLTSILSLVVLWNRFQSLMPFWLAFPSVMVGHVAL